MSDWVLVIAVLALAAVAVCQALRRGDAVLARELSRMADRVVVGHEEQIVRMRHENELELGMDYNRTQRERARFSGSERVAPLTDIHVPPPADG